MKNKSAIIFVALFLAIMVGCSAQNNEPEPAEAASEQEETTSEQVELSPEEIEANISTFEAEEVKMRQIIIDLDAKKCASLESENLQHECTNRINYELAVVNQDPSYCENTLGEEFMIDCEIDASLGLDVE